MAIFAVVLVTAINLCIVGAMSLLAIHGDGSKSEMPWVLAIGTLWVLAFTARSIPLANKGDTKAAASMAAKAIPYALVVMIVGLIAFSLLRG